MWDDNGVITAPSIWDSSKGYEIKCEKNRVKAQKLAILLLFLGHVMLLCPKMIKHAFSFPSHVHCHDLI